MHCPAYREGLSGPVMPAFCRVSGNPWAEAETAADEWAVEMVIRIKAAVDWIRALADTFTEETLETY